MPIILFKCNNPDCVNYIYKFFTPKKKATIPPFLYCGQCGIGKLERQLEAPNSNKTQVIDNGLQPKRIELREEVLEKTRKKIYNEDNE